MEVIKSISPKLLGINGKTAKDGHLYSIIGVVRGVEIKQGQYGDSNLYKGQFRAKLPNGDEFEAFGAFMPGMADAITTEALATADGSEIEIAFAIGKKTDKTSPVGYVYTVKPLIEPTEANQLDELAKKALPKGKSK